MKDFLGNEYDVGDTVVWPAGSGRSITMTVGTVVRFNDSGSVTLQPVKNSRWSRNQDTKHIDTRTGKSFYSWDPENREHAVVWGHQVDTRYPDREIDFIEYTQVPLEFRGYVETVWKDYIFIEKQPIKSVTLQITENIVKLPDGWSNGNS